MAVDQDVELLRENGVEVETFMPYSDSIATMSLVRKAATAIGPVYNASGVREFRCRLDSFKPDVVHVHNVFPLISPSVVNVAADRGIPVVQTLHNYRHSCVNGLHLRNGKICTDCVGTRTKWPALAHSCYRGSRAQTIPMVAAQLLHRSSWGRVSVFIALTEFMKERAIAAGLVAERIVIRRTWVPDPGPPAPLGRHVLFVGRLSEEKGVELLLRAWQLTDKPEGTELRIVGDGPLAGLVADYATKDLSIRPLGRLSSEKIVNQYRESALVTLPSLCFEGLPMVYAEALAHGRPILATSNTSISSVLTPPAGESCSPRPTAMAAALGRLLREPVNVDLPRQEFERRLTSGVGLRSLVAVYQRVRSPLSAVVGAEGA